MPAYKDKAMGTWYASFYFENWTGKKEKKMKRGFKTKREALEWERTFLQQQTADLDMTFESFVALYAADMKGRIKENTWGTKEHILYKKLVPYFGKRKMSEIHSKEVMAWQSEMLNYRDKNGKVSYFADENIIHGSLYRTPEKVRTKGKGKNGKMLTCYVLSKPFKPYFDLWMEERERLGIKSEWLFPDGDDPTQPLPISTLNSWAETFSNILGVPMYWHAMRHFFTTYLAKANLPDSAIKTIIGWESLEMVEIYKDIDGEEEIGKFFKDGEIVGAEQSNLSDL